MRKILLVLALCAPTVLLAQQDIHLSQFWNAPLQYNPATAGIFYGNFRMSATHRIQWGSLSDPYVTTAASIDLPLLSDLTGNDLFGVGLNVYQDEAGNSAFKTLKGNLSLNYGKSFDATESHFISAGFAVGYGQRTIDYSNLNWGRQWNITDFDPGLPTFESSSAAASVDYLDMTGGLHYFYSDHQAWQMHAGLALGHLNRPEVGFYGGEKLLRKYIFTWQAEYHSHKDRVAVSPKLFYMRQGDLVTAVFGAEFDFLLSEAGKILGKTKEVTFETGVFYRWKDSFYPMMGVNLGGYTIAVTYDITLSSLTDQNKALGGPEIFLSYKGGYKRGLKERHSNDRFDRIH